MKKFALMLMAGMIAGCAGTPGGETEVVENREKLCADTGYCPGSSYTGEDLVNRVMFSANYRDSNLEGVDLSGKNLFMTDFSNSNLRDAVFTNSNLSWANFTGADITGADFTGSLLSYANFGNATYGGTKFDQTIGSYTVIGEGLMKDSSWRGAVILADSPPASAPGEALVCAPGCVVPPNVLPDTLEPVRFEDYIEQDKAINQLVSWQRLSPPVVSRLYGYSGRAIIETFDAGYSQTTAITASLTVVSELLPEVINDQTIINSRDYALWASTLETPGRRQAVYRDARKVADQVVAAANKDGYAERSKDYNPAGEGDWARTPPAFNPPTEPGWGNLRTFDKEAALCKVNPPKYDPATESFYVYDLSKKLSEDQKDAARFWDDSRGRTSTPVGHWHVSGIYLLVTDALKNSKSVESVMTNMAYIDMAVADTVIKVWEGKYLYKTPRPSTIIQETDPSWRPYIINPPFPAWPSGHAAVSATASTMLHTVIGDLPYTDPGWGSDRNSIRMLNIKPRNFKNVLDAGREAGMSRVWGGIHVMPDYLEGLDLAECITDKYSGRLIVS